MKKFTIALILFLFSIPSAAQLPTLQEKADN